MLNILWCYGAVVGTVLDIIYSILMLGFSFYAFVCHREEKELVLGILFRHFSAYTRKETSATKVYWACLEIRILLYYTKIVQRYRGNVRVFNKHAFHWL